MKFLSLLTAVLAKVDHHETQEFWVYPGGEQHTHTGTKVFIYPEVTSNLKIRTPSSVASPTLLMVGPMRRGK